MARQRLRLVTIRKPGSFDDQKSPVQIAASETDAADEQAFVESILSQIRQILGTANWYDPVPTTLQALSQIPERKYDVELVGVKDGVNVTFTTPDLFDPDTLLVYVNGVRQQVGAGCDFEVSESGGIGTGYDTITLDSRLAPKVEESVFADYTLRS